MLVSMLHKRMMTPAGFRLDKRIVHVTGCSLMTWLWAGAEGFECPDSLLLYTRGRKSGVERSAVLPYYPVDGKLVIVGSRGGAPKNPAWADNLRADPRVRIRLNRKERDATARILEGEERARVWEIITRQAHTYLKYQARTERQIPLVVLE